MELLEEANRILEALVVDDDALECPDCGQNGCGWDRYDRLEKLAAEVVPELIAEVEQLHDLIRLGLARGDAFRTPAAAGARAELRRVAGAALDKS